MIYMFFLTLRINKYTIYEENNEHVQILPEDPDYKVYKSLGEFVKSKYVTTNSK